LALCALDAMRASLRWLLLCLLGRSALVSHTLGLAISWVSCRFETSEGWVLYIQEAHLYHHRVLSFAGPFLITRVFHLRGPFHHHRVLLLHEAHFYHHWVLLTCEAHFLSSSGLTHLRGPFLIIIGSYSFTRPISSSSGLTPSRGPFPSMLGLTLPRGPFLSMLGLTPPRGPFLIIIGSYSLARPISSSSGLTPSRGPFLSMLGLTPPRGPFLSSSGLTPSRSPFLSSSGLTPSRSSVQQIFKSYSFFRTRKKKEKKIAPTYDVTTNFSSFAKMEKFCPSMALS
jgi:hypothetical protein